MEFDIYQVDAFADEVFGGNPAAIVPLKEWLPDETMQKVAAENNLAETAFFVPTENGFHLRWFTPTVEIPLCGHATLASAHIIYTQLGYDKDEIRFESMSGELIVGRKDEGYVLDFPTAASTSVDIPENLAELIDAPVQEVLTCENSIFSIVRTNSHADVVNARPDHQALMKIKPGNFILTSTSDEYDFVSRVFVPEHGIPEDPVTGSAHCVAAPYWSKVLGKDVMSARQVSERGGNVHCTLKDGRLFMYGTAILYLKGTIYL